MIDDERRLYLKSHYEQGFPAFCGLEVKLMSLGYFEAHVEVRPEHMQQDGFVHAGLIATLADHTAGYAAYTTVSEAFAILTVEFKINYFKPAVGQKLICRSRVINGGKKIIVSESEVFSVGNAQEKLVSKATVTLMAVPMSELE
ncbi:PaaI family thioesterase [bacterium]|nr:PaaI family thioesterase [bacterium]